MLIIKYGDPTTRCYLERGIDLVAVGLGLVPIYLKCDILDYRPDLKLFGLASLYTRRCQPGDRRGDERVQFILVEIGRKEILAIDRTIFN